VYEFELRVSVHRDLMNKIPTRCSNSILFYFPLFPALHVSGVTITHHQELPLYIRVLYIVIADLYCYTIPESTVEAPDDG
jgi:hypothetical protein